VKEGQGGRCMVVGMCWAHAVPKESFTQSLVVGARLLTHQLLLCVTHREPAIAVVKYHLHIARHDSCTGSLLQDTHKHVSW
jgi:hypothetical protein